MREQLNGETRLFPIIGDPIIYVKSPERLTSGTYRLLTARSTHCAGYWYRDW